MQAPIINTEDFSKVFAHIEQMERPFHYRLLMLLVRDLGLRPVELARLQRSWFVRDELRIPAGHSKRGRARSLPVSAEMLEALDVHMGNRTGTVFLNRTGEAFTPGTMGDAITRVFRQAGVRACTYSGRRSAATRMVDSGVNIRIVQEFLGHSNLATTAAYCSVTPNMLRRAVFG